MITYWSLSTTTTNASLIAFTNIEEHCATATGKAFSSIPYVAENGGKWRRLPEKFGHRHTMYARMRGWAKSGVLARIFEVLQQEQIIRIEVSSFDSTSIKVHPDGPSVLSG